MKVRIDHAKCKSHGRCYSFAPDVFERGETGRGEVKVPEFSEDDGETYRAAETGVMMCPAGAVSVDGD